MAVTPSSMLPLGTEAPDFDLPAVRGGRVRLDDLADHQALVVVFTCNHCPYAKHVRDGLIALGRDLEGQDVGMVAISSNDAERYPQDGPEAMKAEAEAHDYPFPYLHDATQEVARAYGATCTPDFFVFDTGRKLRYRGQFDSSRPGSDVPVTGRDVRRAVQALLDHEPVPGEQVPSIGCNIKWRPGSAVG
jgi:peroxiredoxin